MSDAQADIPRNRRPQLRAAALKNFEVKVYDPETDTERPFDLQATMPGCYLNIRWKAPPLEQKEPNAHFPTFQRGAPGVTEYTNVKYLDPASIAHELHSLAVSNLNGADPRDVEFERTKLLRGLWSYFAIVEVSEVKEYETLNFFWAMIIHFHRSGHCLPVMEKEWCADENINKCCAFNGLQRGFLRDASSMAANANANKPQNIAIPSRAMGFVLNMNQIMASQGAKHGTPAYERSRTNVDFVTPVNRISIPAWWQAHDTLYTTTLRHFIKTGVAPCMWLLKETGCKNRNLPASDPNKCREDHTEFVPLVKKLEALLKEPFAVQMKVAVETQVKAIGQGVELSPELIGESGALTPEERQNRLKEKGNEYIFKQDHASAILMYDEAIKIAPNAVAAAAIYSNRSLCNVMKCEYRKALADAEKCIQLRPDWFRGYFRKGFALERLGKFAEAGEAFRFGGSLDATQHNEANMNATRCEESHALSLQTGSKAAQKELQEKLKATSLNAILGDVTAVFFPCDPDRRPYEVKIPSNFMGNPQRIHDLLGITAAEVANIDTFFEKSRTLATEGVIPNDVYPLLYGVKEWAADYKKQHGHGLPYAFQIRELCRGENNKTNLVALYNPQSKKQPNIRMCGMMTAIDDLVNSTDGNPETCKCRGDALVVRFHQSKEDVAANGGPSYKGDRRIMTWRRCQETIQQFGRRVSPDSNVPKGVELGCFIELSAVLNEILQDTAQHHAIDFTYEDYDAVYGLFAHLEIPLSVSQKQRAKNGAGGSKKKIIAPERRLMYSDLKGPNYMTILMPNTKESEKFVANMMNGFMNRL